MNTRITRAIALLLCEACLGFAQERTEISPVRPVGIIFKRPYLPAAVPPVRLANSSRIAAQGEIATTRQKISNSHHSNRRSNKLRRPRRIRLPTRRRASRMRRASSLPS